MSYFRQYRYNCSPGNLDQVNSPITKMLVTVPAPQQQQDQEVFLIGGIVGRLIGSFSGNFCLICNKGLYISPPGLTRLVVAR